MHNLRAFHIFPRLATLHELLELLSRHIGMLQEDGLPLTTDGGGVEVDGVNALYRRDHEHGLHQDVLGDGPEPPRSRSAHECQFRDLPQRALRGMEPNAIHRELEGVLLYKRILGDGKYVHQALLVKTPGRNDDGEPTDVLGDHAVVDEILGYRAIEVPTLDFEVLDVLLHLGPEADGGGVHALVDYLFQARERPAADEQYVRRIDLDEITPGILATGFLCENKEMRGVW